MTFYLKPPRGDMHLEKLFDLACKRLTFLQLLDDHISDLDNEDEAEVFRNERLVEVAHLSEAVVEGSAKDRASHFALRLTAALQMDFEGLDKYVDLEDKLFGFRLRSLRSERSRLNNLLLEAKRHLAHLIELQHFHQGSNMKQILVALYEAIEKLLTLGSPTLPSPKKGPDRVSSGSQVVWVPFQIVPKLVGRRQVVVCNGQALITQDLLLEFLSSVFCTLLKSSIETTRSSKWCAETFRDGDDSGEGQRVVRMTRRVHQMFKQSCCCSSGGWIRRSANNLGPVRITRGQVDELASKHFPPCFKQVHLALKKRGRLDHHSRVAYTLFLKEIGLSLREALMFWASHYSRKPVSGGPSRPGSSSAPKAAGITTGCSHSWQEDARKFRYSINHLYGNAGYQKNYSAHSCGTVIRRGETSPTGILHCAFADDDDDDDDAGCSVLDVEDLLDPRKRCLTHLASQSPALFKDFENGFLLTKPSQYFSISYGPIKVESPPPV